MPAKRQCAVEHGAEVDVAFLAACAVRDADDRSTRHGGRFSLIDLRAGISGNEGKWRVGLFGRNITDKYYWNTAVRRGDAVVRYAGMPATYGIDFSVDIF